MSIEIIVSASHNDKPLQMKREDDTFDVVGYELLEGEAMKQDIGEALVVARTSVILPEGVKLTDVLFTVQFEEHE